MSYEFFHLEFAADQFALFRVVSYEFAVNMKLFL